MPIAITCTCSNSLVASAEWSGREVCCPVCEAVVRVPLAAEAAVFQPDEQWHGSSVLPEGELKLRIEERDQVVEREVELVEEDEDDGSATYSLMPRLAELPDLPPSSVTMGPGFWANIGLIPLRARVSCLAFGPHNQWALAGIDKDVQLLRVSANGIAGVLCGHPGAVTSVAISADGRLALSGDELGNILIWDVATRILIKRLYAHAGSVHALAASPTGEYLVSGGADGIARLWRLDGAFEECALVRTFWQEEVTAVAFSWDGRFVLAGGGDGRIALWEVESGAYLRSFLGADGPICAVHCNGTTVTATATPPNSDLVGLPKVWRWNAFTGSPEICFARSASPRSIASLTALDSDGNRLLIAGRYPLLEPAQIIPNQQARRIVADVLHDVGDGFRDFFSFLDGPTKLVHAMLPATKFSLEVWSPTTGACLHAYPFVAGNIEHLAVSPDNTRILAALSNGNIQVFAMPMS